MKAFKLVFSAAKACFKMVVRSVKIGKAIVFRSSLLLNTIIFNDVTAVISLSMIVFNSRDGHLSRLLQFWLDAVSPLAALLENIEAGELMPEKAVSDTQTTLCLMGNVHQQMSQERWKKLILKFNLSLKFMVEDNKNFVSLVPREEFASKLLLQ